MIPPLTTSFLRARRGVVYMTMFLGVATLVSLPSAHATVVTADTYSIETIVYNTTDSSGNYFDTDPTLMPVFGTTKSYLDSAAGDQTLNVASYETTADGLTTDSITISVPGNFVTSTTDNKGNLANAMEFSIGLYNTGTNTLDFTSKPTGAMISGSCTYSIEGVTHTAGLTQTVSATNNGKSFSVEEAVQSFNPTVALSNYDITSFNLTVTYAAVPEPSALAMSLFGAAGVLWLARRRRMVRA